MAEDYLREVQYRDSGNLAKRANLIVKYGRGDWFPWLAEQASFRNGMRVLDIGCGAGWFWAAASAQVPASLDITLADLSQGMVGEAEARVRGLARWAGVSTLVTDICRLPFDDNSFDRVLAFHMLYHAADKDRALAEIARVLKPDGVALISSNGAADMAPVMALRAKVFGVPAGPAIDFTLESGAPLIEAYFSQVELRKKGDMLRCTDAEDLVAFLTSFPPGDQASAAEIARLRIAAEAAVRDGGGVFAIPKETGVFICSGHS